MSSAVITKRKTKEQSSEDKLLDALASDIKNRSKEDVDHPYKQILMSIMPMYSNTKFSVFF